MVNQLIKLQKSLIALIKKHRLLSALIVSLVIGLSIYSNPQAFINLWLSRDQQAMLTLQQGNAAKAALTFADKNWIAYSYYTDGDFEKAANTYAKIEGLDAEFSRANALAHSGAYFQAKDLYQEIIDANPTHQGALNNHKLMLAAIKKMKKSSGKKELSNEIQKNQKFTVNKDEKSEPKKVPSSEMWLQRVKQNPSKFLAKKFQQEYKNEQK